MHFYILDICIEQIELEGYKRKTVFDWLHADILPSSDQTTQLQDQKVNGELALDESCSEDLVQRARMNNIKYDKRRKVWKVCSQNEEKLFHYGERHGCSAGFALNLALDDLTKLKNLRRSIAHWGAKKCTLFQEKHSLPKFGRCTVDAKRETPVEYAWLTGNTLADPELLEPQEPNGQPQPPAEPPSEPASGAGTSADVPSFISGGGASSSKSGKIHVEDVSKEVFRKKENGQVKADVAAPLSDDISDETTVVMPRVTIVKFLEGVQLYKGHEHMVCGELLGAVLTGRSKHKGRMLIRSLFVSDVTRDASVNEEERQQWFEANPALVVAGRLGDMCIYTYMRHVCGWFKDVCASIQFGH